MSDLIKTLKSSETGDNVYPNIKPDNIESGAVTTAKLDDSAVTTIKLNDGAVTSAKIGSSAVTNAKINDGAVSYDKLATALKNLIDGKASQTDLDIVSGALTSHTGNTSNPHSVTKSQVGLSDVVNKPMDNTPTNNSDNYIKSGGVYTALNDKASLSSENEFNNANTFNNTTTFTDEVDLNFSTLYDEQGGGDSLETKLQDIQSAIDDIHLYHHNIELYISTSEGDIYGVIDIYNNSSVAIENSSGLITAIGSNKYGVNGSNGDASLQSVCVKVSNSALQVGGYWGNQASDNGTNVSLEYIFDNVTQIL